MGDELDGQLRRASAARRPAEPHRETRSAGTRQHSDGGAMRGTSGRNRLSLVALLGGLMVTGCEDDDVTERELEDSSVEVDERDGGESTRRDSAVSPQQD